MRKERKYNNDTKIALTITQYNIVTAIMSLGLETSSWSELEVFLSFKKSCQPAANVRGGHSRGMSGTGMSVCQTVSATYCHRPPNCCDSGNWGPCRRRRPGGRLGGGLDVIGHPSSLRPPTARSRELFGAPSRLIVSVPLNNRIAKRFVGRYCPRRNRILT